jgi:hypothetical protein
MEAHGGQDGGRENRREHRRRVLKGARIVFNGGYSVLDCRVRNLSSGGAMIEVPSSLGIPGKFDVAIDAQPHRPCTVMWRTETLMGVAFDDASAAGAGSAGPAPAST